MFEGFLKKIGYVQTLDLFYFKVYWLFPYILIVFLTLEWVGRNSKFAIEKLFLKRSKFIRIFFYYVVIILSIWFLINGEEKDFIYFQF